MENRNLSDIYGENMTTPSILNSGYKTQNSVRPQSEPIQQQPMPVHQQSMPVQQQTMPIQQQVAPPRQSPSAADAKQAEIISVPIKIQPMPLEPIEMPFKILPMPVEPVQMQLAQQPSPPQPQPTYNAEQMRQAEISFQLVYPDIFYKLQPHIIKACDRMDAQGLGPPAGDTLEKLSSDVYNEACRMYPEIAEDRNCSGASADDAAEQSASRRRCNCCRNPCCRPSPYRRAAFDETDQGPRRYPQPQPYWQRDRYYDYGCCGRRGILGDLIRIMLINELYRRRGRFY